MIILLTLITSSHDNVWILLGENCCWSLLGVKGLNHTLYSFLQGAKKVSFTACLNGYSLPEWQAVQHLLAQNSFQLASLKIIVI